jgi:cell division protein FtsQ
VTNSGAMQTFARRRMRLTVGVAALLATLASLGMWLRTSSLVRVNSVTVSGVEGRQAKQVRNALTTAGLDMTTLAVDEGRLMDAVSSYPIVHSLRTSTDFPHKLRIVVNSYRPIAALRTQGALVAVAADGTILRGSATKGLGLVGVKTIPGGDRVSDADTLRAIGVLATAPGPLRARIERVFRGSRGLAATVQDGPKLYFGGGERLRAKWSAAAQVLGHEGTQAATYVDLRVPERPVAGGFQPRTAIVSPSTVG